MLTQHDPGQSYALYLPEKYTPEKNWPMLYACGPNGEGRAMIGLFCKQIDNIRNQF